MADGEKGNSTDQILQAFDALSNLYQARAARRATSPALPGTGDAAVEEARRPRHRRRLSPRSPFGSKPMLDKNDDGVEEGDDAAFIVVVRGRGLPLMLPLRSSSKQLDKKQVDDYDDDEEEEEDDDDSTNSTATREADGETKERIIMSWAGAAIRAVSHIGMRRMGCLFSLEVVAAQGLPPSLNGLRVAVTVRRKETRDGAVQTTTPARVQLGVARFDEALYLRCHLYDTGGGTTGKPLGFEPQPFLLSLVAIHAPELDFGRSTVDLSLFAMEFTDKCQQGECVRQWDMVFPLDRKAKGGELVLKLAIQSIDDGGTGSYSQRKLLRPSLSNMLTLKMTRTNSLKMRVSAPELRGIDSFMLDEPEPELTPVVEVMKGKQQQKEPEREPADEPTPEAEVDEEEQQKKESEEREAADEPTAEAEVEEEQQKKESEEREAADESTPEAEVEEEEQQKKEPGRELADVPTPEVEVKEEKQQKKEPAEYEVVDEASPEAEVQNKESECEPAHVSTPEAEVVEEEQLRETKREPADEPTPVTEVNEEEQQNESKREPSDEPTPEVEEEEEQQREPEHEPAPEAAKEDDDSELLEFNAIDRGVEGQEVKSELKEEDEANKGFEEEDEAPLFTGDEVATTVVNGLEEKSVEAAMPNGMSEVVVEAVELMDDAELARPEQMTGESLQLPEQREDKGTAAKPSRLRFKWRTVALLVPIAVTFSKTLGAAR